MRLISKRREHIRNLSPDECDLVLRYSAQAVTGQEVERANRLLRQIRMDARWVECDCVRPCPVMHVRLEDNGKLVLSNNPGTHEHAPQCPCGKSPATNSLASGSKKPDTTRFDRSDAIALHVEFSGTTPLRNAQISSRSAYAIRGPVERKKPVLSLLLTLCDDAGLNVYSPARPVSLSEQFRNIREAAERYTLAQGIPLASAIDTRIDMRRMIQLGQRLKSMPHRKGRVVGLLFDRIEGFGARTLNLAGGKEIGFFGHVEKFGPLPGPLLAMATVTTQAPGSSFFELGHVAMIPAVSGKTLFPVGSEFERVLVTSLMGLVDWMHREVATVTIHRHLLGGDAFPAYVLKAADCLLELRIGPFEPSPENEETTVFDIDTSQVLWVSPDDDLDVIKRRISGYFRKNTRKGSS